MIMMQKMNSRKKKIFAFIVTLILFIAAMEFEARLFWLLGYGVPFLSPDRILYSYYKEIKEADRINPARNDGYFDILLLGGSVVHKRYGRVEQELYNQLTATGCQNIRIFNLSEDGHTSRDSYLKYAALDKARFDLVIFYHGINDTRANNCPPGIFKNNYGHYTWYEQVNSLAVYHGNTLFALPYTFHYLAIRIRQALTKNRYVPLHMPGEDWIIYGNNLHSVDAFRQNLGNIIDIASYRGDRVLLMTFATSLSLNDLRRIEASKEETNEITRVKRIFSLWGKPDNVLAGVAAQNDVIRGLANKNKDIKFVDIAGTMTGVSSYFSDPCHLTNDGSSKFVHNILSTIISINKQSN